MRVTTAVLRCPRCEGRATIAIVELTAPGTDLPRHDIRFTCTRGCAIDGPQAVRLWADARMRALGSWSDGCPDQHASEAAAAEAWTRALPTT